MKKRAFPKDLKFGAYLPKSSSKRLIRIDDATQALERFITEYFNGIANVRVNLNTVKTDSIFLSDEYTAYLMRSIMAAIYSESVIDISITNADKKLTICFSTDGKYKPDDSEIYESLSEFAQKSGFELIFTGNGIALRAPVLQGKIVISAISKESFYQKLMRIFFANQDGIFKENENSETV